MLLNQCQHKLAKQTTTSKQRQANKQQKANNRQQKHFEMCSQKKNTAGNGECTIVYEMDAISADSRTKHNRMECNVYYVCSHKIS